MLKDTLRIKKTAKPIYTSDRVMFGETLAELYNMRWMIEVSILYLKQTFDDRCFNTHKFKHYVTMYLSFDCTIP